MAGISDVYVGVGAGLACRIRIAVAMGQLERLSGSYGGLGVGTGGSAGR